MHILIGAHARLMELVHTVAPAQCTGKRIWCTRGYELWCTWWVFRQGIISHRPQSGAKSLTALVQGEQPCAQSTAPSAPCTREFHRPLCTGEGFLCAPTLVPPSAPWQDRMCTIGFLTAGSPCAPGNGRGRLRGFTAPLHQRIPPHRTTPHQEYLVHQ